MKNKSVPKWSLTEGGRLREVVARRELTVLVLVGTFSATPKEGIVMDTRS